ncbi:MAG TPA: response regulator [Polyangiaceae bacterium]|jgi:DNA-binding NarL/FixJ family response regulator|nr:response regulator [Polyangiaceae bacterium]
MVDQPVIVVVDDSEIILERIKARLEMEGYRVVATAQTVGAARHLKGASLVIIDWHMPGMSGGDVLESFQRAVAGSAKRPAFYLYTSDPTISGAAKKTGFDGTFVNKGDDESLVQQVAAALRIAKLKARANSG